MESCYGSKDDLIAQKAAWFFWYLPIALIVAGGSWHQGLVWLWVPAFLIAGLGCVLNAVKCGRVHCYFTGPLYLAAAVFVVLSALAVVRLHPALFLAVIVAATCLAGCAEVPLGRYRKHA
jgi:hypothetical protein